MSLIGILCLRSSTCWLLITYYRNNDRDHISLKGTIFTDICYFRIFAMSVIIVLLLRAYSSSSRFPLRRIPVSIFTAHKYVVEITKNPHMQVFKDTVYYWSFCYGFCHWIFCATQRFCSLKFAFMIGIQSWSSWIDNVDNNNNNNDDKNNSTRTAWLNWVTLSDCVRVQTEKRTWTLDMKNFILSVVAPQVP